jgi:hypothetical protein
VDPKIQSRHRKLRPRRSVAPPDFHALHSFTDGLSRIHKHSSAFPELSRDRC